MSNMDLYKKKYKEAMDRMELCVRSGLKITPEYIFPELAESEDEKVRKWIINEIKIKHHNLDEENVDFVDKAIAWLEKQGEQKPEENKGNIGGISPTWSEEDTFKVQRICKYLNEAKKYYADITEVRECIEWLKSLQDRVQPQHKQEWSEDDETVLNNLIYALENDRIGNNRDEYVDWLKSIKSRVQPKQEWSEEDKYMYDILCGTIENTDINENTKYKLISWLKSLRPQNKWKPSSEQIKVCKEVYADILSAKGYDLGTVVSELNRLEEQLKKL